MAGVGAGGEWQEARWEQGWYGSGGPDGSEGRGW